MLSNNNDAQLADFGNAVLASSVLTFTESSAHSRLSTRWAAPEQLLGEATYSRQADIYSLGMTILEIISRQLPYAEIKHEAAVMMTVLRQQHPKRPEDTIPTDSRQGNTLWSLLKSCWNWDPQDRPEAPHIVNTIETIESGDLLIKLPELDTKPSSLRLQLSLNASETKRRPENFEEQNLHIKKHRLDMDGSSTLQLEPSVEQIRNFPSKTCHTMPSSDTGIMGDTAPLADFKELMPIGASLGLQSDELDEIEQLVARLQFLRGLRKPNQNAGGTASQAEFEELVSIGTSLGLQPDELSEIEQLVARLQFLRELRKLNQNTLALNRVEKLISHGQAAGLSSDHEAMAKLLRLKQLVLDGRVLRGRTGGSES
ncbi:hypothetical protein FRC12_014278 [Ceratobasidium sp. 428]|nr:hypothetical protein FRC12_014278 [Ceratobasidium sp. 428]